MPGVLAPTPKSPVVPASSRPPVGFDPSPSQRVRAADLERLVELVHRTGERPWQEVINPSTGSSIGAVPVCTPDDVASAIARARRAQEAWAHRSFAERAEPLLRFAEVVLVRQEEILDLIQLENGKARRNAFEEVADCALVANYYAAEAERILAPKRRRGLFPALTVTKVYHHPLGVVGFIAPWNYPLTLAVTDAFAALMAGNGVVLKPDSQTPFTALWALDLLRQCGLPEDLFQVVTGEGSVLGHPLIAGVDYVCFTGSTAVGRLVARHAGERLIGCSAELGGKNPMLVLADADLEAAVSGAVRACFSNAGQLCISIERMFVHDALYETFRDRFVTATRALAVGTSLDYQTEMGPLISAKQLATVVHHVEDAVAKGARVLTGGRVRPDLGPYFFEPTILEGVTPEMVLFAEETFGPVVALYRFDSLNEAIERANDTRYGLNASVWTRDTDLAWRVGSRLQAGTVNVNEAYAAAWGSVDAPMGGFKDSGLGRRHGPEGITKYTEAQTIALQRGIPVAPLRGMSTARYAELMTTSIRLLRKVGL